MKFQATALALAAASTISYGDPQPLQEVLVVGDQIDAVNINQPHAMNTAQLLADVSGVAINTNGKLSHIPQIRGLFGSRQHVSLDGASLAPAGPNWMDPPLSYVNPQRVASIEVIAGIAPVSSGQVTIGGAIIVNSTRPEFTESDQFEYSGNLDFQTSSSTQNSDVYSMLSLANQRHRLQLSGEHLKGEDDKFPNGTLTPTEYKKQTVSIYYGFKTGNHQFDIDLSRNNTGDTGTPALPMDIAYIDGDLWRFGYRFNQHNIDIKANVFSSNLLHGMTNYHLRTAPANGAMWRRNTTDADNSGFNLSATFADESGYWSLGADYSDSTHNAYIDNPNNGMFFLSSFVDANNQTSGVFVERKQQLQDDMWLLTGARFNQTTTDANDVEGTPAMMMQSATMLRDTFNNSQKRRKFDAIDVAAKLNYALSDTTGTFAGVARKSRSPSYQELYLWIPLESTGGLADGNTYTGNVALEQETADEFELGLDYNSNKLRVSARGFYRDFNNFIHGTPSTNAAAIMLNNMMRPGSNAPLQFNNVDATFKGAELQADIQMSNNIYLSGLINYVHAIDNFSNQPLYRIAPLNGRLSISWVAQHFGATIENILVAHQHRVSTNHHEQATAGYGLINLGGFWRINDSAQVHLSIENLTNKVYQHHLGGYNRAANDDIAIGDRLYGTERNVKLAVRFNF